MIISAFGITQVWTSCCLNTKAVLLAQGWVGATMIPSNFNCFPRVVLGSTFQDNLAAERNGLKNSQWRDKLDYRPLDNGRVNTLFGISNRRIFEFLSIFIFFILQQVKMARRELILHLMPATQKQKYLSKSWLTTKKCPLIGRRQISKTGWNYKCVDNPNKSYQKYFKQN